MFKLMGKKIFEFYAKFFCSTKPMYFLPEIDPVQLENEKLKDQKLCKICMDRELSITFLPCAHLASCEECSKSLFECPICRMPIQDTVKVFWS